MQDGSMAKGIGSKSTAKAGHWRGPLGALLAFSAASLISACTANVTAPQVESVSEIETAETPTVPSNPQGALDEFTARIYGIPANQTIEQMQEGAEAFTRFTEEYIAACMSAQGFTYISNLYTGTQEFVVSEGPARGSREFAETYGFGVFNMIQGDGGGEITSITRINFDDDPNFAFRDQMSDSEFIAFEYALHGEFNDNRHYVVRGGGGCQGRAQEAWQPADKPEFHAIRDEVWRFTDSIQLDPMMLSLDAEWAICMTGQGYPSLRNPFSLRETLWAEMNFIRNPTVQTELAEAWDWEANPAGPPEFARMEDGRPVLTAQIAALEAFRDREIVLAIADVDCREQIDFDARQNVITLQLQQEFVDRNLAELEAWATAAENARGSR